ncbi:MAG: GNAT family N-acetyltransferase [Clostridia bacterium]|nr:GNAT family N-acetyltransferase [Clostridia bacterium]
MDRTRETERLILRAHRAEDWADFCRCFGDAEVVRFEPYRAMSGEEARQALAARIGNDAFIALETKQDHRYIGNVYFREDEMHAVELGYVLARDAWHRGYAAEACRVLIEDAFARGVHRIWAECDPQNTASWKLLERLGFVREAHLHQNVFFWKDEQGNPIWKDTYQYALLHPGEKPPVILREAGLEELARIAALKRQIHQLHVNGRPDLFRPFSGEEAFAEYAIAKNCALLLAEINGEPVGYVLVQYVNRSSNPYMNERRFVHVEEFCVEDSHHRMGIGRRLMEGLRELARKNGYSRIELDVWGFNESARRFYEAMGMKPFRTFMELNV